MEPNTPQNPYLPLPNHEPQICYAPPGEPIQELEPAKYPSFDQPQPHQQPQFAPPAYPEIELKSQHLNATCPVHTYPLDTVCRALDCEKRLLCCQCAVEHKNNFSGHEETFGPLQELLDDAIMAQLDNMAQEDYMIREEQISVEVGEEKGERNPVQKANSPIANLKMQMSKMMGQVQKEAGKMGDWFTEKQNMLGSDNLRREYLEKKKKFLEARPGCQTMELAQLVEVVNKIKRKQCKLENKMQKAWEGQKSKMNKFVAKWQEKSVKLQEKGQKNIDKKIKNVEKFCKKLGF